MLWDHGHSDLLLLHLLLCCIGVDVFSDLALRLLDLLLGLRLLHCLGSLCCLRVGGEGVEEAREGGRGEEHPGEV